MVTKHKVVWDKIAVVYLKQAIAYIKKDSPKNAKKVKTDILASANDLTKQAGKQFPPDKYRLNNDGNYRAFELHHFRISYHITEEYIRIVRIRHTGMQPKNY